jgi:hypothetical protein
MPILAQMLTITIINGYRNITSQRRPNPIFALIENISVIDDGSLSAASVIMLRPIDFRIKGDMHRFRIY